MEIYTTGFTKKSAEQFFTELRDHGIRRLIDVRVNNVSQLAAFAKRDDLRFFLREFAGIEYRHEPLLAPTKELLKGYRDGSVSWDDYEGAFRDLMLERRVQEHFSRADLSPSTVLLCSENTAERCHRRLVVEYLDECWGEVEGVHI